MKLFRGGADGLFVHQHADVRHKTNEAANIDDCHRFDLAAFSTIESDTSRFSTIGCVTSNSLIFFCDGRWYIRSSINSSRIMRSPRAPTLRERASRAIALSESSVNFSFTFSNSKSRWYCLVIAFLGLVRICTSAASS